MTWQTKKLGEVLKVQNGYAFDSKKFSNGKGVPLIRIRDLKNGHNTETRYTGIYKKQYEVKSGDFLIGMDGEFGCYEWKGGKALLNQRVCRLQNFKGLDSRFLFYGINKYLKDIEDHTGFTTVKHISSKQIESIEFPYPESLVEQKRIVKILDEAFEKTAKANENTEKNLQNSKELFESYLQAVFANPSKDWEQTTVEKLVDQGIIYKPQDGNHGEIHPKKKDYIKNGVPFLMACDLKDGVVDVINSKFITKKQAESLRTGFAKNDDVLLSHKATIGRSAVLKTNDEYAMLTPQVTYYRIKDNKRLFNYFVYYYFLSPRFQSEMLLYAEVGSTRAYIGITKQLKLTFIVPPLSEQKTIVKKLDVLSMETKKLENNYSRKLTDLDEFKKSILNKAFTQSL